MDPQLKDDWSIFFGFSQLSHGVNEHLVVLRHPALSTRHDVKLQDPRHLAPDQFPVLILF
jgi:hypothetical protein